MLVLTRKIGEEIQIDGDIQIKVVSIRGNYVRIGIDAPKHKKIKRLELKEPQISHSRPENIKIAQDLINKQKSQLWAIWEAKNGKK